MSIRKRLTLLILSMVILTCFLAFTKGYRESMNQAEALLDNELVTLAHVLIEQPLSKETPAYTSDLPQLLFQVWVDDSLVSSSKSLQMRTRCFPILMNYSKQLPHWYAKGLPFYPTPTMILCLL